jgi:hypothetical protein
MVLGDLDWKKSQLYLDYVLGKRNSRMLFENDSRVLKEDEIEYIKTMITENKESS